MTLRLNLCVWKDGSTARGPGGLFRAWEMGFSFGSAAEIT